MDKDESLKQEPIRGWFTADEFVEMADRRTKEWAKQADIPDLIAGALGVSRGTAYDMMREALKEALLVQEPVAWMHTMIDDVVIRHRPADLNRHPERWKPLYKDPTPCQTCQALARTVMMDQTAHDITPLAAQPALVQEPDHPSCNCEREPHKMHWGWCAYAKSKVEWAEVSQKARYCAHIESEWLKLNPLAAQPAPVHDVDWKDQYEKQKRRSEMWVAKYEKDIGPIEYAVPVAAPVQKPVAWRYDLKHAGSFSGVSREYSPVKLSIGENWTPLYITPPAAQRQWVDPNEKSQKQFLPHIGEPVLFCHDGVTYFGKHTGGSFTTGQGITTRNFNTWECHWMYPPSAKLKEKNT